MDLAHPYKVRRLLRPVGDRMTWLACGCLKRGFNVEAGYLYEFYGKFMVNIPDIDPMG